MDITSLFPIIVPRSYNDHGRWVGPLKNLRHPELAVTWVALNEPESMSYVSHSDAAHFRATGVDYEAIALQNLKEMSEDQLFTHEKRVNGILIFAAAMHPDGLGSSRLLLTEQWQAYFPHGCEMALPERSCAIVIPRDIPEEERLSVLAIVDRCYADGTTPMLPGFLSSDQFEVEG